MTSTGVGLGNGVIAAAGVEVPPLAAEEAAGVGPLEKRPQPAVSMAAPASIPMNLVVEVKSRIMVGEL